MAFTVVDQGEKALLSQIAMDSQQKVILFIADILITDGTVYSQVTGANEASFPDYMRQTPVWGAPTTDANGKGTMTAQPITFTRGLGINPAQNVYGWALVSGTNLIGGERFPDAPKVFANQGDARTITPTMKLFNSP